MLLSKKTEPYIRILGFNNKGKHLLSEINRANPRLQIITYVKSFMDSNANKNQKIMLEKDIWATNVYTLAFDNDSWSNLDYTQKLVSI